MKKIPTIPVATKGMHRKPTYNRRKETNEEVMLASIRLRGYIRCNLNFRLLHAESVQYTSWNGQTLTVDMPGIKEAREFRTKLGDAVERIAKETGCALLESRIRRISDEHVSGNKA
jgi:hypothetical protein